MDADIRLTDWLPIKRVTILINIVARIAIRSRSAGVFCLIMAYGLSQKQMTIEIILLLINGMHESDEYTRDGPT